MTDNLSGRHDVPERGWHRDAGSPWCAACMASLPVAEGASWNEARWCPRSVEARRASRWADQRWWRHSCRCRAVIDS